ncbi:MAG TPA: hypothetical protein ENG09_02220, partial [Candidatus Syntrophoarchaeum butanivorans]|nr:hypothetical protein [Candidatus Syntrophoarchaeum butanivorans]
MIGKTLEKGARLLKQYSKRGLDTGKEYVNEVKKILLSLKNSLEEDLEEGMQNKDSGMYQGFSEITQGIFSFAYRKLKGVDMPGITTG